jgi:hypothetical protein
MFCKKVIVTGNIFDMLANLNVSQQGVGPVFPMLHFQHTLLCPSKCRSKATAMVSADRNV